MTVRHEPVGLAGGWRGDGRPRRARVAAPHDRHDPRSGDGRRAAGGRRAPRHGDGAGAARVCAVQAGAVRQPPQPAVGEPRPLRAECRACVRAAVLATAPQRLRALTRGPDAVPPVGLAHPGASRAWAHPGRGDHHGPARAGLRQRGGDGDVRALPGRALQPPRRRGGGSPHLCDLLRRGHDGGHQPGGRLDRRTLRAGPADGVLRRQPHHDRRQHRDLLRRREPHRAAGGGRMARAAGRGLRGHRRAHRGARGRAHGNRAPVVHRGALAHRLPRSPRRGYGGLARRAAGRGGGARGEARDGLRPGAPLLGRRAGVRAHGPRRRRRGGRARVAGADGRLA